MASDHQEVFSKIQIHPRVYEQILRESGWHRKIDSLQRRLALIEQRGGTASGNVAKFLKNGGIKLDWNASDRIIAKIERHNGTRVLKFLALEDHETAARRHREQGGRLNQDAEVVMIDFGELGNLTVAPADNAALEGLDRVFREFRPAHDVRRIDDFPEAELPWSLSDDQRRNCDVYAPLLLRGGAGSGKTTVALSKLIDTAEAGYEALYITFTEQLQQHAEETFRALASKGAAAVRFVTIERLCRELAENSNERFPVASRMTFGRFQRLASLSEFLQKLAPEVLWEEIRGVLKGDGMDPLDQTTYLSLPEGRGLVPLSGSVP